jgi:hypothetical protein
MCAHIAAAAVAAVRILHLFSALWGAVHVLVVSSRIRLHVCILLCTDSTLSQTHMRMIAANTTTNTTIAISMVYIIAVLFKQVE